MRPIWKGSISFGLLTIPVAVVSATREEELKFRLLRGSDLSPVNYKRIAAVDGKEVPWDQIVKGYDYEKGRFVVLKDADFKRVDLEATDTIEIMDFVELDRINPVYFYKPYYLAVQKGERSRLQAVARGPEQDQSRGHRQDRDPHPPASRRGQGQRRPARARPGVV